MKRGSILIGLFFIFALCGPGACQMSGKVADDDSDPGTDSDSDGDSDTDVDDETICEETGGTWDPGSCGHYVCGQEPYCDALIPGCDCGNDSIFLSSVGCLTSDECGACPDPDDPRVHYVSQDPDVCAVIDFICEGGQDYMTSPECGCGCIDTEEKYLCESTDGTWDPSSCGHYFCGQQPDCEALIPGCNCGGTANFEDGAGCVESGEC